MLTSPPSTVFELKSVLIGYDQTRPRTMQQELGPSEIGSECLAQIARKIAGAPEQPLVEPEWAPFQGTAIHTEMEKVVHFWNTEIGKQRFLPEHEVRVGEDIVGHSDVYDTNHCMVIDWKLVGTTTRKKCLQAQRKGLPPKDQLKQLYRAQLHLYGFGYEMLGYRVDWVRAVLLPRSWQFRDAVEWTEAYNPDLVDWALKRYDWLREEWAALTSTMTNDEAIREIKMTPGDECAWCRFRGATTRPTWLACPGDVARREHTRAREMDGIIP